MNFFRIRLGLVPTRGRRFLLSPVVDRISFFSTFESENLISSSAPLNSGISSPAPFKSGISSSSSRSLSPASQRRFLLKQLRNEKIGAVGDLLKDIRDQSSDEKRTIGDLNRWARLFEKEGRRELSLEVFKFLLATVHIPRAKKTKTKVSPKKFCLGIYAITDAAAVVLPSVVRVDIVPGSYGDNKTHAMGTGFFIGGNTVLTCLEAVKNPKVRYRPRAGAVSIRFGCGRVRYGTIKAIEESLDLALVTVLDIEAQPAVKFGSGSSIRAGELVVSISCLEGLNFSITQGVISCTRRTKFDMGIGVKGEENVYLQTDCVLSIGSLGSPLINLEGKVIGVIVMSHMLGTGVGLALPVEKIMTFLEGNGF